MPSKLVAMNHLRDGHSPKDKWMVALEWFVNATPLVGAPKTTLILSQANHHMCLLKNGYNMAIQLQP
jgi:hypothetical protein